MSTALFTLRVDRLDLTENSVTFAVRSTQELRRIALSRFFVLKTLEQHGTYPISQQLRSLVASTGERSLEDPRVADRFIVKTRITALENYIHWENIDHQATLEKLLPMMDIPSSYHLKVWFTGPEHLTGFAVGDLLESHHTDGWIVGIVDLLCADPGNIYSFKDYDEQWRLGAFLDVPGEDSIAWTNAQATLMARTGGLLPWVDGGRWGAVDSDGATIVPLVHDDIDYRGGVLHFKKDGRWIPVDELR